ncbi:radical SAM protein, partial [Candidatus Fermentibacteria bacterium]|nr:radical SAM protein [Candidatus Fermentibacteria bacterium]
NLLAEVADAAAPAWVRFVTSHPRDFSDELIEVIACHPNVCRQVHLPVQSGSSRVLGLMNRGYGREEYLDLVRRLRSALPGVVLSTDVIAGFPGETEADFEDTVSLLSEVRYDYAFLFRYSERRGTAAAGLPDGVPVGVRLSRLGVLQTLQAGITRERSAELAGRTMPVLVTGRGSRPGQSAGRTAGNRMVVFDGEQLEPGLFVRAFVISGDGWTHFARSAGVIADDKSRPPADEGGCR